MKKLLSVLLVITVGLFIYENLFVYEYVSKEVKWNTSEYLWEVGARCAGPHEDVREVIFRIEKDNPGAKPGDILKVKVKVRR